MKREDKTMTWEEYMEEMIEGGANFENAQNVIGHMMDLYESYNWDDVVPFEL